MRTLPAITLILVLGTTAARADTWECARDKGGATILTLTTDAPGKPATVTEGATAAQVAAYTGSKRWLKWEWPILAPSFQFMLTPDGRGWIVDLVKTSTKTDTMRWPFPAASTASTPLSSRLSSTCSI